MFVTYSDMWDAYCKALRTWDPDDWRLYIALSDIYCHA